MLVKTNSTTKCGVNLKIHIRTLHLECCTVDYTQFKEEHSFQYVKHYFVIRCGLLHGFASLARFFQTYLWCVVVPRIWGTCMCFWNTWGVHVEDICSTFRKWNQHMFEGTVGLRMSYMWKTRAQLFLGNMPRNTPHVLPTTAWLIQCGSTIKQASWASEL